MAKNGKAKRKSPVGYSWGGVIAPGAAFADRGPFGGSVNPKPVRPSAAPSDGGSTGGNGGGKKGGKSGGKKGGGGNSNPILDPANFNPSPGQVRTAINSAADIKYNPALNDLGGQLTSARQFQGDISGWYNQYRTALGAARDNTAAFYQGVASAGGQVPPPSSTGNALEDAAAQNRYQLGNMFNGALVAQGGNNVQNFNDKTANSGLLETGSHIQQQRNIDAIKKTRAQTKQEKGDYKNTYAMDLHDKLANNLLAAKAFDLNVTSEQDRHSEALAGIKQAAQQARAGTAKDKATFIAKYGLTPKQVRTMSPQALKAWKQTWSKSPKTPTDKLNDAKLAYFKKHGYFPPTGPGKAKGAVTPKDARKNGNSWDQAKRYLAHHKGEVNTSQVMDTLTLGYQIPEDIARAAVYRARHGGKVTPKVAAALRKLGITVSQGHVKGSGGGSKGTTASPGDYGNSHRGD